MELHAGLKNEVAKGFETDIFLGENEAKLIQYLIKKKKMEIEELFKLEHLLGSALYNLKVAERAAASKGPFWKASVSQYWHSFLGHVLYCYKELKKLEKKLLTDETKDEDLTKTIVKFNNRAERILRIAIEEEKEIIEVEAKSKKFKDDRLRSKWIEMQLHRKKKGLGILGL